MAKPNELKLAADIIRRVLEAAERGDVEFLDYLKMISRQRPHNVKGSGIAKQNNLDLQRPGGKISQESFLNEIARFDDERSLGEYLRRKYSSKNEVTLIARALRVPVPKTDDYEKLIDRIIGATLGYKMRSEAVRGSQTLQDGKKKEEK